MDRRSFLVSSAAIVALGRSVTSQAAKGSSPKTLQLFGTPLKRAKRADLREVFRKNGLRATREDDRYWVDTYDAKGVLEGATEFQAGYVMADGLFAFARYTFPGFMNTGLVGEVARMVQTKYGYRATNKAARSSGRSRSLGK